MKNTYEVTVSVHDGKNVVGDTDDTIDDAIDVTITLTNVNEAPSVVTDIARVGFMENRDATELAGVFRAGDPDVPTTFTWTLGGDDGALFTITASSDTEAGVRFNASPDFEMPADHDQDNEYRVTVRATDNGSPTALFDEHSYVVAVSNVNEAGTVTISGDLSGGQELTAEVTDLDGEPTDVTWQWAREDSTGFTDIDEATSANYTTVAADVDKFLQATASYTDPHDSGKTASGVSSGTGDGQQLRANVQRWRLGRPRPRAPCRRTARRRTSGRR